MKANPRLKEMPFLRIPRLSVSRVTEARWRQIRRMAGE
ncbi:MAG: EVE domain-containing protein [Halobacteria archaeon]